MNESSNHRYQYQSHRTRWRCRCDTGSIRSIVIRRKPRASHSQLSCEEHMNYAPIHWRSLVCIQMHFSFTLRWCQKMFEPISNASSLIIQWLYDQDMDNSRSNLGYFFLWCLGNYVQTEFVEVLQILMKSFVITSFQTVLWEDYAMTISLTFVAQTNPVMRLPLLANAWGGTVICCVTERYM